MADNRLAGFSVAELKRIRNKGLDDITNLTNREKGRGGTFKGVF